MERLKKDLAHIKKDGIDSSALFRRVCKYLEELARYKDAMPLERAQELAQAERDGRLVVIPRPPQDGDNAVLAAVFRGQESPMVMHGGGDTDDLIALTHLLVSYTAEATGVNYAEFCHGMGEMEPTTGFEQREEEKNADPPD